jgi:hypothetical protein
LYDIRIERNRISLMGLNGIGPIGFFELTDTSELISVDGLCILGNSIEKCLLRALADTPGALSDAAGYGGISLPDVKDVAIWDNRIVNNGFNWLDPVCGIFVLHAEALDIQRNTIENNGARTAQPPTSAKPGARGGIVIEHAVAPTDPFMSPAGAAPLTGVRTRGVPALRVRDNIVSAPLGLALMVNALGPVSVVANSFASLAEVRAAALAPGAVFILNLGLPIEFFGKLLTFQAIAQGTLGTGTFVAAPAAVPQLPQGTVLFTDNHCTLDVLEPANTTTISVMILTLDDAGVQDNQFMFNLLTGTPLSHLYAFGFSVRTVANRFEEPLQPPTASFSAITLGIQNNTTHNQATHCILAAGWTGLTINDPNTVLADVLFSGLCKERLSGLLPTFGKKG